jgi:polyisoprenoid-binding protein YceI
MKYAVGAGSKLLVQARSKIHDTTTTWTVIKGEVDADPETLAVAGATARLVVDMTQFDAGDWLRNRKIKKDFEMDSHPEAIFELRAVRDVVRNGAEFTATAEGVVRWRGREAPLVIAGKGTLDARGLVASGTFELDIKKLGLSAPRFLMFKMEDEVEVQVTLRGTAAP